MNRESKSKKSDAGDIGGSIGGIQLFGAFCCVIAIFLFLSLVSYEWRDVGALCTPPNDPKRNILGPLGAAVAYNCFVWIGYAAWLVPLWFALGGISLIAGRSEHRMRKLVWGGVFTLAMTCILQLSMAVFSRPLELQNLAFAGGMVGWVLMDNLLVQWLNPVGGGIVAWCVLLVSGVFLMGVESLRTTHRASIGVARHFGQAFREWQEEIETRREEAAEGARQTRLDHERSEEEAARKIKEQEKAARDEERKQRERERAADAERKTNDAAAQRELFQRREAEERRRVAKEKAEREQREVAARKQAESPPGEEASQEDAESEELEPYKLPPITLLDPLPDNVAVDDSSETDATAELLVDTLSEFGLDVKVTNVEVGPVVTRYELLPAPGIRVERISRLSNNIALVLKATSVRVQAPIPGKGVVGIEVPNRVSRVVTGREIIESGKWHSTKAAVPLVLGKDVAGQDIVADLATMPHVLIAGATGSGKSVCMNSILAGLLMSRTPDQLRLMLVDPKIVEFSVYNHLPHLVVPVITDPGKVALGLRWAINEMEKRYKLFAKVGVRNIASFNSREIATQTDLFGEEKPLHPDAPAALPYIVVIIDELADLMLAAGAEIENSIARLAQLSRAVGIHMILATQRPSVNVITGTIKANFPARIAFQVAQKVDSRTILDAQGAETLLGRGDMLFAPPSSSKLVRAQGALVSDAEIARVVDFIKQQRKPSYIREIKETLENPERASDGGSSGGSSDTSGSDADDELLEKAVEIIRETRRASTSSLQRRLRIGYTRAARLMDVLEDRGIIGPPMGSGPREILIDLDEEIPDNPVDVESDSSDDAEPEDNGSSA